MRKNGAQLYGPNFLSHRIVKSVTFRIYGKLKFQCTRNGPQNPPVCPWSPQDTFFIFPRYPTTRFPQKQMQEHEVSKLGNLKIQKPRFTIKCPVWYQCGVTLSQLGVTLVSLWDHFGPIGVHPKIT